MTLHIHRRVGSHAPPERRPSEEGYILVAVMFMLAILIIAMSVAAPQIAKSIQRERELETMHRGKQYARAVKLYYKQFNTYPPNLDALVKTNEIRFLRKKYVDPTTGKEEWKPIRFGQQKTQTLGFFGQPIGGTGLAGGGLNGNAGMIGGNGGGGSSGIGGIGSSNGIGAGGIGSGGIGSGSSGSSIGGGTSGVVGTTGNSTTDGSTGDSGNGQTGTAGGAFGASGSGNGGASSSGTPGGQTFGGIGIIGFSPNSPKQSIYVYKKKNHYNEWEFFYDPMADQMMMQGGNLGTIGTPAGGMNGNSQFGNSTFGGNSGIGGGSTLGGGIGGSSGANPTGGNGNNGTTPTQPQQ
jgi:type II secretory pathway pseudopilin PulG